MGRRTVTRKHVPDAEQDAGLTLERLLQQGYTPQDLGGLYELYQLLGAVVGQHTLIGIAAGSADDKARVTAARALAKLGTSPQALAERLRQSVFGKLSSVQLKEVVELVQQGKDVKVALEEVTHAAVPLETHPEAASVLPMRGRRRHA
jgi:hypothetical protein